MSTIKKVNVNGQEYDLAGSGGGGALIDTTYAELVSLKDSSGLVPGNRYRITDYVSTFNSGISSANHAFDIIVTADSESSLSCMAKAAPHAEDSYFSGCDLSKWILYYDIDNNTNRYKLANPEGKGYIYRMIDEYGNDVEFDFKNLLFEVSSDTFHFIPESSSAYFYLFSCVEDATNLSLIEDFSTKYPSKCYNNKIEFKGTSAKISSGLLSGVVFCVAKGLLPLSLTRVSANKVGASANAFVFSKGMGSGLIENNLIYNNFILMSICGNITGNLIKGNFSFGIQNWNSSTYNIVLGDLTENSILSGISLYVQDKGGIGFIRNFVAASFGPININANITGCRFWGNFESSHISDDTENKLIIGNGSNNPIIVDPTTAFL